MKRADVQLDPGQARVIDDEAKQAPAALTSSVNQLSVQATVASVTVAPPPTLLIEGVTDRTAARAAERALKRVRGVSRAGVDPGTELYIDFDPRVTSVRDLIAALGAAGFKARVP